MADSVAPPTGTYGRSRFRVGDPLPVVLTNQELGAVLGLSPTRTCELQRLGEFAVFEVLPRIGDRARYSGKKVQQWLDGELETSYGGPVRRRWPGASR